MRQAFSAVFPLCAPQRRRKENAMKIGLASYECRMNDIGFNLKQIEKAIVESKDANLVCFGEAFLQGFAAVTSDYAADSKMAAEQDSLPMAKIRELSLQYRKAVMVGYIEKDGRDIYSSYALIENGEIVHNYRRISKNWKDYEKTCKNYREGTDTSPFLFHGVEMTAALCGDLWIYPESFRCSGLLIWPVYVNFDLDESESGEYAKQAAMACGKALLVNPLSKEPLSRGGAFFFENGKVKKSLGLDKEGVLVVEV